MLTARRNGLNPKHIGRCDWLKVWVTRKISRVERHDPAQTIGGQAGGQAGVVGLFSADPVSDEEGLPSPICRIRLLQDGDESFQEAKTTRGIFDAQAKAASGLGRASAKVPELCDVLCRGNKRVLISREFPQCPANRLVQWVCPMGKTGKNTGVKKITHQSWSLYRSARAKSAGSEGRSSTASESSSSQRSSTSTEGARFSVGESFESSLSNWAIRAESFRRWF